MLVDAARLAGQNHHSSMPRAERVVYGQQGMQQLFSVCSFWFSVQHVRQNRGAQAAACSLFSKLLLRRFRA
jgi:hypothetical protein